MEINDIVKVKALDYTDVPVPTEAEAKKQHKKLIKELTSLSGDVFKVVSKHTVEEQNYIVIESLERKNLTIDTNEHAITLLENEVDVIETDYLNNCCLAFLGSGTIRDDYICETCGFNIRTLLSRYDKKQTTKTKTKTTS